MIGAPKAPGGGMSITSLPRTETTKAPTAPTTQAPETGGKGAKQTGREANNPVLQRLMADGFEGQGAQGKGLALGKHKNAEKKAGKKGGGEAGETPAPGAPTTGAPTTGKPSGTPAQGGVEKLLADLTKLLQQFQSAYPQPTTPTAPTAPNGNTGIVPPGTAQGTPVPVKLDGI